MIKKPVLFFIQFLLVTLFLLVVSSPILALFSGSKTLFFVSIPASTLFLAIFITDIVSWKKGKNNDKSS